MRRPLAGLLGMATLAAAALTVPGSAVAQDNCTVALIPGLTTDAFYITMRKGAEMAAQAVGCELLFQGGPEFNPTVQVPVLQAVIARKPGAILIAPTDKQQLIA
ncbi:MAG TPA: substrate-binding domain-containing protein, partial [Geminicoccaceae bacterium]|nr:substrate-binding domain-containing protein [Geminicoccaceae bacterium]